MSTSIKALLEQHLRDAEIPLANVKILLAEIAEKLDDLPMEISEVRETVAVLHCFASSATHYVEELQTGNAAMWPAMSGPGGQA